MSPTNQPPIQVRKGTTNDAPFIHSSWYKSYWPQAKKLHISHGVYAKEFPKRIQGALTSGMTLIAHPTGIEDEICAWVVFDWSALHWCYTKQAYRRLGIMKGLLTTITQKAPLTYSLRPGAPGRQLLEKFNLEFNPFALR